MEDGLLEALCYKLEGRRFRFPMRSLDFAIDLIISATLWPWRSTQSLTEMSTRNLPGGKGRLVRKADNLTAICGRLSRRCGSPDVSQTYAPPQTATEIALPL
jgi:hypothetical protein